MLRATGRTQHNVVRRLGGKNAVQNLVGLERKCPGAVAGFNRLVGTKDGGTWAATGALRTGRYRGEFCNSQRLLERSNVSPEKPVRSGVWLFVSADVSYSVSEHWSTVAGCRLQGLSTYKHKIGEGEMRLDLGQSFIVSLGVRYSF